MTNEVVISVRGEATTTVMPDDAYVVTVVRTVEATQAEAVRSGVAALDAFRDVLAGLGGETREAERPRTPLSWTASSANTRDFALLTPLSAAIAAHDTVRLHRIGWSVDDDNPGWATVRADAIGVGLGRAGDYAEAIGAGKDLAGAATE
jgi:hypothetical protein